MNADNTPGQPQRPVLVVDDDPNFRKIVQFTLEMLGYAVLSSGAAEDAVELAARNGNIQLLITDIAMPVMNGAELARKIRETQPHVEVLYVSGFPFQAMAGRGLAIDSKHYLQKPFPANVLDERIKAILGYEKD